MSADVRKIAVEVMALEQGRARRMSVRAFLAEGEKRVDVEGLIEAGNRYGDDIERELMDIEAGRHPLQRRGAGSARRSCDGR